MFGLMIMRMTMNRAEKKITNPEEIRDIARQARICRVAMVEGDIPYVIPLNFVMSGDCLYFHSATKGKKIDILSKNKNVCFEMEIDTQIITGETPCAWGMKYECVIGYGSAFFVHKHEEKIKVLNLLMEKYAGRSDHTYPENIVKKTMIVGVKITKLTGKKSHLP